jgi:hypothetical protein
MGYSRIGTDFTVCNRQCSLAGHLFQRKPIDGGEPRPLTPEGYGAPKNLVAPDENQE